MKLLFDTNNVIINKLLNSFDDILINIGFSSKRMSYDEFDKERVGNEEDIIYRYINGSLILVDYPRGLVYFHNKNKWKMDCLDTYFIMKKNLIPNVYHNLPTQFKINRTNGNSCYAVTVLFESLFLSEKESDFLVHCNFKKNNTEFNIKEGDNALHFWGSELQKNISLQEIMRINNIEIITFTFNIFSNDTIDNMIEINSNKIKDILLFFNEKLFEWVDTIIQPFINRHKLPIKVVYNCI
tara:strand:+ start:92 stop:811 length:720 start_codon:yes stop_codon:yes gene_type:complete